MDLLHVVCVAMSEKTAQKLTVQPVTENFECYKTWNEKREPRLPFELIVASILVALIKLNHFCGGVP